VARSCAEERASGPGVAGACPEWSEGWATAPPTITWAHLFLGGVLLMVSASVAAVILPDLL